MDTSEVQSPYLPMFEGFRTALDEHHDRRERVIKRSRDITASSKKIIFGLQRMRTVSQPIPQSIQKAIQSHEDVMSSNYAEVSKDLQGLNNYRYARNINGGNQEFMESVTFKHYLATGKLLTYDESCALFRGLCAGEQGTSTDDAPSLSMEDYVLGLYDMTGELMRFAITTMATGGELPSVGEEGSGRTVLTDLRALAAGLEGLEFGHGSSFARDVQKKMEVMRTSVGKVERALYGLIVRGAERPKGWMPDLEGGRQVDVEG